MQVKKSNGGSTEAELELDHELPPAENGEEPSSQATTGTAAVEEPRSEVERLRAECAAYLDRAARLQAEFENFRKRSQKQQQEYREYAVADAIKALLPILDSLDRALKTNAASLEDFHSGIELIDKQFHDALAKLGVQPIAAEGEAFDPNLHQAVMQQPSKDFKPMTVLQVLEPGYMIHDRVLRPARVIVSVAPADEKKEGE